MVVAGDVEDDAATNDRGHLVEEEVLLRDEKAGAARAADKLVRAEEGHVHGRCVRGVQVDGVVRPQGKKKSNCWR